MNWLIDWTLSWMGSDSHLTTTVKLSVCLSQLAQYSVSSKISLMTSHSCKISTLENTNCVPKKYYFRCAFFLFILRRIFSLPTAKMRHLIFQAKTTFSDVQHWHVTKPIYTLPIPCAHTWWVWICVFYLPQFSCVSLSLSKCVYRFYPRLYTRLLAIHKCMEKWAPAVLLAIHCMGVEYILFAFLAQLHVHQTVRFYISLFGNTHSHNEPRVLCAPVLFPLFIIVFPRFRFLSAFVRWLYYSDFTIIPSSLLPSLVQLNELLYTRTLTKKGPHLCAYVLRIHNYKWVNRCCYYYFFLPSLVTLVPRIDDDNPYLCCWIGWRGESESEIEYCVCVPKIIAKWIRIA